MATTVKLFLILTIGIWVGSCKPETDSIAPIEESVALMVLGINDSLNQKFNTLGRGIDLYSYINLQNDSVYIRKKYYFGEPWRLETKAGFIDGISKNEAIRHGLDKLQEIPPGFITKTLNSEGANFCGPQICLKLVKDGETRYYFYLKRKLDPELKLLTNILLDLRDSKELTDLKIHNQFNEETAMFSITKAKGFEFVTPAPIVSEIKFTPPNSLK